MALRGRTFLACQIDGPLELCKDAMPEEKKITVTVHSATLAEGQLFVEESDQQKPGLFFQTEKTRPGKRTTGQFRIQIPETQGFARVELVHDKRLLECWRSQQGSPAIRNFCKDKDLVAGQELQIVRREDGSFSFEVPPQTTHLAEEIRFVDLFAGIGGMHFGFQNHGKCVFALERDKFCQRSYKHLHGDITAGDIKKRGIKTFIPDHDVLLAGFPCQPFSIAGVSKKNNLDLPHGFECKTQGNLFYDIVSILKRKQPRAFLLENVKNLKSHDGGNTFKVIEEKLKGLGYSVASKVLDAANFVPQHRERIFIVGFLGDCNPDFVFDGFQPRRPPQRPVVRDILEPEEDVLDKYHLSTKLWKYLRAYRRKHEQRGNGFGFRLIQKCDFDTAQTATLSARYHKDGAEILIDRGGQKNPRRLTPLECARLMGFCDFKEQFPITVSDTQAYRQFGNALVPKVVTFLAKSIVGHISDGTVPFQSPEKTPHRMAA